MGDGPGPARDTTDRSHGCPGCGWRGPETATRGASAGGPAGADLACPRCGAPVAADLPSIPEILAARRGPQPED